MTNKGVGLSVGTEVEHTEGLSTGYEIKPGANGCGENVAWYLYEKWCVTTYSVRYHTWEWAGLVPYPCWCCGCCQTAVELCKAGESVIFETCDRDC